MDIRNVDRVPAFATKDGSEIRELLAHRNSCIRHQTLAEARLPAGGSTTPHHHVQTEEIYYILEGRGLMRVGGETACAELPVGVPHGQSGPGLMARDGLLLTASLSPEQAADGRVSGHAVGAAVLPSVDVKIQNQVATALRLSYAEAAWGTPASGHLRVVRASAVAVNVSAAGRGRADE